MSNILLSREELFDLVWKSPLTKLCSELGISDRGIAKICKRYQIPIPGIGYWNKLYAGHKVGKKSLPILNKNNNPFITIRSVPRAIEPLSEEIGFAVAFEQDIKNKIKLRTKLGHTLTKKLSISLSKEKNPKGMLYAQHGWIDSFRITEASVRRALLILDTLFLSLENRGHEVN